MKKIAFSGSFHKMAELCPVIFYKQKNRPGIKIPSLFFLQ